MIRNLLYVFAFILAFTSCGGGEATKTESQEKQSEFSELISDYTYLDLSEYGYAIEIPVPNDSISEPKIQLEPTGELVISHGKYFRLAVGTNADLAYKKEDIELSDVYTSEFITDSDSLLVYKQTIEGTSVEPKHHFYYTRLINNNLFEFYSFETNENYSLRWVERMVECVKYAKSTQRIES